MGHFSDALNAHLKGIGWSKYRLAKAYPAHEDYVYKVLRSEKAPGDEFILALSKIEGLGLPYGVLMGWALADRHSPEELFQGIEGHFSNPGELRQFLAGLGLTVTVKASGKVVKDKGSEPRANGE